jgi:hypothetical protein
MEFAWILHEEYPFAALRENCCLAVFPAIDDTYELAAALDASVEFIDEGGALEADYVDEETSCAVSVTPRGLLLIAPFLLPSELAPPIEGSRLDAVVAWWGYNGQEIVVWRRGVQVLAFDPYDVRFEGATPDFGAYGDAITASGALARDFAVESEGQRLMALLRAVSGLMVTEAMLTAPAALLRLTDRS